MTPKEIDHEITDNIVCPWCGEEIRDSWEYSSDFDDIECGECERKFQYSRTITVYYSTEKVGDSHDIEEDSDG
jgi:hypothetical protein